MRNSPRFSIEKNRGDSFTHHYINMICIAKAILICEQEASSIEGASFIDKTIKLLNTILTSIMIMEELIFRPKRSVIFRHGQAKGFEINYEEISHWNISTCGCGQDDIIRESALLEW